MEEKRYHFSPPMIARLFGVPSEKETETGNKLHSADVTTFGNKDEIIEKTGTLMRTLEPESVPNEKTLIATQKASDDYYPTRGVVTVGILMSVVGLLLFSPTKLPLIYRFVGGIGFFIMGISVIGSGLLNSRKNREVKTE
jgi:hypothetical protein